MDVGVRNRKNKTSPKSGKKTKGSDGGQTHPADTDALKKSIEKLQHLNENINRDSVSTSGWVDVYLCVCSPGSVLGGVEMPPQPGPLNLHLPVYR
ncbi:hypothetical protein E2C01_054491 [Portunus trituberculatus]|uniref:Uncharacterized protein n=1 Tax=Portunus trituberculatus TaxID=210409 RepID=A0A5B7GS42_PORTR|nr:hypothetical protein [Portunus trituberculatus]